MKELFDLGSMEGWSAGRFSATFLIYEVFISVCDSRVFINNRTIQTNILSGFQSRAHNHGLFLQWLALLLQESQSTTGCHLGVPCALASSHAGFFSLSLFVRSSRVTGFPWSTPKDGTGPVEDICCWCHHCTQNTLTLSFQMHARNYRHPCPGTAAW